MIRSICLPLALLLSAAAVPAQKAVDWRLELDILQQKVRVAMKVSGLARQQLTVAMPVWKPGSYRLLNFGRAVRNVTAKGHDGKPVEVKAGDNYTWTVPCSGDTITIHYELPLHRPKELHPDICPKGVGRMLSLPAPIPEDADHQPPQNEDEPEKPARVHYREAYVFEGPATWMYMPDAIKTLQRVHFVLQDKWEVATGMDAVAGKKGHFTCPDYDVLADCPFHVGRFQRLTFTAENVPHHIILTGVRVPKTQQEDLVSRVKKIVRAQFHMMGKPPYRHYTFLIAGGGFGGGGLEHLNSTNCMIGGTIRGGSADGLLAHEFFHLWNVKRLRPKPLGPFDYSKPVRSRYLWVCEGFTSYYGPLSCVRAGLADSKRYWTTSIARQINSLQRNSGRLRISVADTSWTVWDFPYLRRSARQEAPSYYNKGQLLGLLLDIEIRHATKGRRSLDDVMRALYLQCMEKGEGFADGDVRKWCEKVGGRSFKDFFAKYVDGTDELPFTEVLAKVGLSARVDERKAGDDKKGQLPRRRARQRWRVQFLENATKEAIALREAMTKVVVEDK